MPRFLAEGIWENGYDDKTQLADIAEKLDELKQNLLEQEGGSRGVRTI